MLTALLTTASGRAVLLTDTTPAALPAGVVRQVVAVGPDALSERLALGVETSSGQLLVLLPQDGAWVLRLDYVDVLSGQLLDSSAPLPYLHLPTLRAHMAAAYLRHAERPGVGGNDAGWRALWGRHYEARAAFAEGNHTMVKQLAAPYAAAPLPTGYPAASPTGLAIAAGLPRLPTGVLTDVGPEQVRVWVDIASAQLLTAQVTGPDRQGAATYALESDAPGRATFAFPAAADGLYRVVLLLAGSVLASFLAPVSRAAFGRFRRRSRELAYAFAGPGPVRPSADWLSQLTHLIGAEAAARIGRPELYAKALAAAINEDEARPLGVSAGSDPITLYPHRRP